MYTVDKMEVLNKHYQFTLCNMFLQIVLVAYGYYYTWQWSIELAKYCGINHKNDILVSAICMFITQVISHIINLPIAIYDTFVLEEKHGFNKQVRFLSLYFAIGLSYLVVYLTIFYREGWL